MQDPSTIEHETTATGDVYTVVDKTNRKSKKEGGASDKVTESETSTDVSLIMNSH